MLFVFFLIFRNVLINNGHLNLKQPKSDSKRSRTSVESYDQQFSAEIDWILEKVDQNKVKQDREIRLSVAEIAAKARLGDISCSNKLTTNDVVQHPTVPALISGQPVPYTSVQSLPSMYVLYFYFLAY